MAAFSKKSIPKIGISPLAKYANFQHFWTFRKIAGLWEALVAKPLDRQETTGYQWKDKSHIFHLAPTSTLCDQCLATVRVGKNRLIWNMPEIRSVSSSCVLYDRPHNQASWELLYLISCGFLETETLVKGFDFLFYSNNYYGLWLFHQIRMCIVMSLFPSSHEDLKYFRRQMRAAPYYVTVKLENY